LEFNPKYKLKFNLKGFQKFLKKGSWESLNFATTIVDMKSEKANKKLADLVKSSKKSWDSESIASALLEIREIAKAEADPAIVKILRLASEYISANDGFDTGYLSSDEENADLEMSDFDYLIELIIHSDKESNRSEIKEIRNLLVGQLY
jgi:hypothetical protein